MDPRVERITWRTVFGFLVLAIFIGLMVAPIAIWFGGSGRTIVIRLAVALLVALVLYRLISSLREWAGIGEVSQADLAVQPREPAVRLDPLLFRLAGEFRTGLRWHIVPTAVQKRLRHLSRQGTGDVLLELVAPPDHWLTWHNVERALDRLEDEA
jgi:hypothetical protein